MTSIGEPREMELRDLAIQRLKNKKDFRAHLLAYVLVNAMLAGIWWVTSTAFFWPIFPIAGWGIGLVFHAWDTYGRPYPTEADIEREMHHLAHS